MNCEDYVFINTILFSFSVPVNNFIAILKIVTFNYFRVIFCEKECKTQKVKLNTEIQVKSLGNAVP